MKKHTAAKPAPALRCRAVRSADAATIEALFGIKGACGGCWCMHWRAPKGGAAWQACKGEPNRRAFLDLLARGRIHGALAFAGPKPVGWCSFGPREDFPRLQGSRVLAYDAAPATWSVNCFYVAPGWRRCGVATALLATAIETCFARGAAVIEAYPTPQRAGQAIAAAFAWTGTKALFAHAGFRPNAQNPRIYLKRPSRKRAQ